MPQPTKQSTRKRGGVSSDRDPFSKREAGKYEKPIPSREFILEKLEEAGTPVQLGELFILLELRDADQHEALRRRLIAMSRDGQAHKQSKRRVWLDISYGSETRLSHWQERRLWLL